MKHSKVIDSIKAVGAFLMLAWAPCHAQEPRPDNVGAYQLFAWLKTGEKDGYLFADKPEIRLQGDVVNVRTATVSVNIAKGDLDKFTLEQVKADDPTAITMPATLLLGYKRTEQLDYELQPADAVTTVTWFNSAPEVVGLSGNGLLTGLQPGTSLLRVQTSNGLRAACQVTVPVPRYRLLVWLRDGSKASVHDFSDKPEVTISGEEFIVASSRTTVSYPAKDIWKFTLEDGSLLADALPGDVNQDGQVGIGDIVAITNVMAGIDVNSGHVQRADVNGDTQVGIGDIVAVTNIMAGQVQ